MIDGDRGASYPSAHDFAPEGYCLFLSAKNVTKAGFAFAECQFVSKSKHEQLRKGKVLPGDLVLTTRGTVGNVGYLHNLNGYGAIRINSGMVVIRNTGEVVDTNYLYALFRAPIIERQIETMNFGSAQPQLTVKIINDLQLPLPTLPEQRRIAEILATWDRAIETVEALIANARAQKKALMQQLLTGTKRLPGFEDAWTNHDFGEIAQAVKTKVDPRALPDDALGIELEHIESETGRLVGTCRANEQVSLKTPFTPGNILYGKLRPYLRKFNKPDFRGVCSTEIWVLAVKPKRCLPDYLHFIVQSPTFEGAVDVSSGSKMPRADWGIVSDTVFSTPSIQEQAAIAALLNDADHMLGGCESQRTALRQEKSALMQQLLTGKRRLKISEKEHE